MEELVDGILRCGAIEEAVGKVYSLTGDKPVSLNRLVQVIAEALSVSAPRMHLPVTPVYVAGFILELLCKPFGIHPPLYRRRVDFFRKTRCFDVSKAKAELGFRPMTDLKTGVALTAAWYRENSLL